MKRVPGVLFLSITLMGDCVIDRKGIPDTLFNVNPGNKMSQTSVKKTQKCKFEGCNTQGAVKQTEKCKFKRKNITA